MWQALPDLCSRLAADTAVRVVICRGQGREAFSAGGDIVEFREQRSNRPQAEQYNRHVQTALDALLALPQPTIALIHGFCVGGGLLLAAHCDLRIASGSARFGLPVAKLGFLITYEQMQRFVHLLGAGAVADLLLTARLLGAEEARVLGLCSQVHPPETLDEAVESLAQRMAELSPQYMEETAVAAVAFFFPDVGVSCAALSRVSTSFPLSQGLTTKSVAPSFIPRTARSMSA